MVFLEALKNQFATTISAPWVLGVIFKPLFYFILFFS